MLMSDESLAGLLERIRADDPAAVKVFLDRYGDAIQREVRFCLLDQRLRRVVGESDIFQSVVSGFVRGLQSGRLEVAEPRALLALLRQMTRIRVAFHSRFWSAQRRDLARTEPLPPDTSQASLRVEATAARQVEQSDLLSAVMQRLPARDLEILNWRLEGTSWDDIARRTGASSGEAVRKRHSREIDRVSQELMPDDDLRTEI
jgi:DNA-directed RNA polymerase specialized sigma24 family protein